MDSKSTPPKQSRRLLRRPLSQLMRRLSTLRTGPKDCVADRVEPAVPPSDSPVTPPPLHGHHDLSESCSRSALTHALHQVARHREAAAPPSPPRAPATVSFSTRARRAARPPRPSDRAITPARAFSGLAARLRGGDEVSELTSDSAASASGRGSGDDSVGDDGLPDVSDVARRMGKGRDVRANTRLSKRVLRERSDIVDAENRWLKERLTHLQMAEMEVSSLREKVSELEWALDVVRDDADRVRDDALDVVWGHQDLAEAETPLLDSDQHLLACSDL